MHDTLEICPPVLLATFQSLNLVNGEVKLLFQSLDEGLVEECNSQFLSQFTAYGAAATAHLTINRNDKLLVLIHILGVFIVYVFLPNDLYKSFATL